MELPPFFFLSFFNARRERGVRAVSRTKRVKLHYQPSIKFERRVREKIKTRTQKSVGAI